MNKNLIRKLGWLFFFMIVIRVLLIVFFNYINVHSSNYIEAENNGIDINNIMDSNLYSVFDIHNDVEKKVFYISSDKRLELNLLIDNLRYLHTIYINDKTATQNIDKYEVGYDSNYAYKILHIYQSDYIDNIIKISIIGEKTDRTNIFVSRGDVKSKIEIRSILNLIFLIFLFLYTFAVLILYFYNLKEYYYLIYAIMGITSLLKTVALGEFSVLYHWLGISAYNYTFIDQITNIINTVIPIIIICYLFDYKIKRRYVITGFIIILMLGYKLIRIGGNLNLYFAIFFLTFIMSNIIMSVAYIKDKSYSRVIMHNSIIYSSCVIYYMLVLNGAFKSGSVLFYMNPSYLGVTIYMGGFVLALLFKYLDRIKTLEGERKEYERVLLLRGISHDLKLPLSVIKLNNQMIEKYDLTAEEIKEYTKASLDAALELEKMTQNINSYLSLGQINNKSQVSNIRECFNKLKEYYSIVNRYDNCRFIVECDDKDCKLNINPLYFNRVLYNLIDNAFKYNEDDVLVKVSYKIENKLIIAVEDNGIGMDKDEIAKVFEPFYQSDHSRTAGGMGLGLSIVREIVKSIGGVIEVKSEKNIGTRISLMFSKFII